MAFIDSLNRSYYRPHPPTPAEPLEVPRIVLPGQPHEDGCASNVMHLRWFQPEGFDRLKDAQYSLLTAFCGGGKSLLQVALAMDDILQSGYTRKQLFIVPQSHLHKGFSSQDTLKYISLHLPEQKTPFSWKVLHNWCTSESQKITRLREWLLTPAETLAKRSHHQLYNNNLVAIASYHAFAMAIQKFTDVEMIQACQNLTLRGDEAHHISGVYDVDEEGLSEKQKAAIDEQSTRVGRFCRFLFNNAETAKMCLSTATAFRGDGTYILHPEVESRFTTFHVPFVEVWPQLGIDKFPVRYTEYDNSEELFQLVHSRIKEDPDHRWFVVLPARGDKWRDSGDEMYLRVRTLLTGLFPESEICDLVGKHKQENRKRLLEEPTTPEKGTPKFRVVLTCMMGREGTDWVPCDRIINLACEGSVTLAIQTMGRAFRKWEGKKEVQFDYFIKRFKVPKPTMTKAELLNDRTNAMLLTIQRDEIFRPVTFPLIPSGKSNSDPNGHSGTATLSDVLRGSYQYIIKTSLALLEADEIKGSESVTAIISKVVLKALEEGRISQPDVVRANFDNVVDAIRRIWANQQLAANGINRPELMEISVLREDGYAKLKEDHKLNGVYFAEYSGEDFLFLREKMREYADRTNSDWWGMFTAARDLVVKKPKLLMVMFAPRMVGRGKIPEDKMKLIDWLRDQIAIYSIGNLDEKQVEAFTTIPGWRWTPEVKEAPKVPFIPPASEFDHYDARRPKAPVVVLQTEKENLRKNLLTKPPF